VHHVLQLNWPMYVLQATLNAQLPVNFQANVLNLLIVIPWTASKTNKDAPKSVKLVTQQNHKIRQAVKINIAVLHYQTELMDGKMSVCQPKHALKRLIMFKLHVEEASQKIHVIQLNPTLGAPLDNNAPQDQILH